jgi:hypothetical protein
VYSLWIASQTNIGGGDMSDSRNKTKDDFDDFGPDDFEGVENPPPPPRNNASSVELRDADEVAYDDVGDEDGHEKEVINGNSEEDEVDEQPREKSMLSKLIIPVGVSVLGGFGVLTAWQMGFFGGGQDDFAAAAPPPQPPALIAQAPQAMPQVQRPNPPQLPVQAQAPQAPQMPVQAQAPQAPQMPVQAQAPQAPQMPPMVVPPAPVMPPMPTQQANAAANNELTNSIAMLVDEMRAANRRANNESAVMVEVRSMRDTIVGRFDSLDNRVGALNQRMDVVDGRLNGLETRISSLENRPATQTVPVANNRPSTPQTQVSIPPTQTARHANPSAATRNTQVARPRTERPTTRVVENADVTEYRLLGASRDKALVQTPAGAVIEIDIGGRLPNGVVARGFRQEGDNWILVTSSGDIRP